MPYDIKCKDKKITYYDYSNNEFEEKIRKLFNINNILDIIYYIEGNEWNKWTNPTKEITKKYWIVHRSNNRDLLTQLDTFVKIYKSELMARQQARMKQDFNGDLDQLINVS